MAESNLLKSISDFVRQMYQSLVELFNKPLKRRSITPYDVQVRQRVVKLNDYYSGNQIDYLKQLLSEQFASGTFVSNLSMQPNIRNIVKYLGDTVPFTFREGILVQASTEADQKILNQILDDNHFDNFCRSIDKMTYLLKTTFVKVSWRNDRVALDLLTPEFIKIETDDFDPYELTKFGYPLKLTDRNLTNPKGIFCVWDKDNFYYVDDAGTILQNPENPSNTNPYSIIPVTTFRELEPTGNEFWQWPGEELLNAQDNLNVKLTFRNYLFKRFNIPNPVLLGNATITNGKYPSVDGSEIIHIMSDSLDSAGAFDFKWVTPSTSMSDVLAVINEEIRAIFISQGIDPNLFIESADRQSGYSIAMMNAKLEERRAVTKLSYQYSLEELFDIIRIVYNTHSTDRISDGKIQITIPEPQLAYTSEAEKWTDYEKKLGLNLLTPADILLLERNDVANKSEAEAIIQENAKANRSVKISSVITKSISG